MSKPRHVLRYHFAATISGDVDYDMADPASYTKALEAVSEKHRQLAAMGAVITKDARKPVVVRAPLAVLVERPDDMPTRPAFMDRPVQK